jgi:DnaK suppressor protein
MAKTKIKKNNKPTPAKKANIKSANKIVKVTVPSKKKAPAANAAKSKNTPAPKAKPVKKAIPQKVKKATSRPKKIEYVAVTPKSKSIPARGQSVGAAKKPATKADSGAKPAGAAIPAARAPQRNARGFAPKPLARQTTPVKLGQIPDYKPEMPAISNKDVVIQPASSKKEDNRNRYSDKELQEFKALLLDKLDQAKKDYELLKNTLCHTDDHGTDDTSPTFKMLEDGSDVLTREETAQLALRQEKFIQNLQNALIRIANKTYGICRVTGKLIPKERLRRVPHATLSIDAKLEQQYNK